MQANSATLQVPNNSTVAFAVGTHIDIYQTGTGELIVSPISGVTIRSRNGLKLGGQYALATIIKTATNEWVLAGDVKA